MIKPSKASDRMHSSREVERMILTSRNECEKTYKKNNLKAKTYRVNDRMGRSSFMPRQCLTVNIFLLPS